MATASPLMQIRNGPTRRDVVIRVGRHENRSRDPAGDRRSLFSKHGPIGLFIGLARRSSMLLRPKLFTCSHSRVFAMRWCDLPPISDSLPRLNFPMKIVEKAVGVWTQIEGGSRRLKSSVLPDLEFPSQTGGISDSV